MFESYLIRKSDTLDSIAKRCGTTKEYLIDINNLYSLADFKEGREIIVPKQSEQYFNTYIIEKGDTLYAIAKKYDINPTLLSALNGINENDYIYPNQEIMVPKTGYSYYITADGDTLKTVADAFGTNVDKLISENKSIYLMAEQLIVLKK